MNFVLSTERTQLIPFQIGDWELFHQVNIDPHVRKYLWDDEIISEAISKEIRELNQKIREYL